LYTGTVLAQIVPSVEYCNVDPVGQLFIAEEMLPPATVQFGDVQLLLIIVTLFGVIFDKSGQLHVGGQVSGLVVTGVLVRLLISGSILQLHLVTIVWSGPS
jgi:hypothetical protein